MPGERNQVNRETGGGRSTEGQNKKKAPRMESNVEGSCEQLDHPQVSSPFPVESVTSPISSQIPENCADAQNVLPTASLAERDRKQLSRKLPAEMWLHVFKQLDNPTDLENVSNSSLYFRDLLSSQRVSFLFNNVWNNVLGHLFYWNYTCRGNIYDIVIPPNSDELSGNDENNEETVGGREDWYKEIVKLRLVSHTWSTTIDNFYQNHPIHFRLQNYIDRNEDKVRDFLHANNHLSNFHQGRRENLLLRHFAPTHANTNRNPFLGRCVHILIQSGHDDNFVDEILSVLLVYGHHIWYSSIVICDFESRVECYSRIWEILQLLPNLKILRVENMEADDNRRLSPMESEELHTEIELKPLPTLKQLQILTTSDLRPLIFLELIRRNGHVGTLDIDREESRFRYGVFKVPLQNLQKLAVSFYSESSFLKMSRDTVNWPLTSLQLNLASTSTFIDWQRVFNGLQKFENTLTDLDLKLPVAVDEADKHRIYRQSHTFRLNLPLITRLQVEMGNLSCLDFLLPMNESLTRFVIIVNMGGTDNDTNIYRQLKKMEAGTGRIIKFLTCVKRPWNTNVWTLFPKLNQVWLQVHTSESERDIWHYDARDRWQRSIQ